MDRWRRENRVVVCVGLVVAVATTVGAVSIGSPPVLMWMLGFLSGTFLVLSLLVLRVIGRGRPRRGLVD